MVLFLHPLSSRPSSYLLYIVSWLFIKYSIVRTKYLETFYSFYLHYCNIVNLYFGAYDII